MGSIPSQCGEEFEVTASGRSKSAAKENAQIKADDLCTRLKSKCDRAKEKEKSGSFEDPPDIVDGKPLFVYTATYKCEKNPDLVT